MGSYSDPNITPPMGQAVPLGLQHVLAMFASNVTPSVIVAGAAGLQFGGAEQVYLIQMAMLFAGIATLFQTVGFGPIGARLPIRYKLRICWCFSRYCSNTRLRCRLNFLYYWWLNTFCLRFSNCKYSISFPTSCHGISYSCDRALSSTSGHKVCSRRSSRFSNGSRKLWLSNALDGCTYSHCGSSWI